MTATSTALESPVPLLQRSDRIDRHRNVKWQLWPKRTLRQDDLDAESLSCRRPDLEDGSIIAWGLQQSKNATGKGVQIDVLYGSGLDLKWPFDLEDDELSRVLELPAPSLRVCFINTLATDESWLPGNFHPRPSTIRILRKAGLSDILLCNLYSEESYWAKMGNQKFVSYADDGSLASYEVCYQYRCGWDTGVSFIHAIRDRKRSTYFCFNYPSGAQDRIKAIFKHESRRAVLHRDFFFDTLVADDSLKQWQFDIGQRRLMLLNIEKALEKPGTVDPVDQATSGDLPTFRDRLNGVAPTALKGFYIDKKRDIEQQSGTTVAAPGGLDRVDTPQLWNQQLDSNFRHSDKPQEIDFDKATRQLHRMVRHWLGLRQDCEDLLAQLKFLQATHTHINEKRGQDWTCDRKCDAGESFEVLASQCDVCVRWAQVYHDRTQMRINLLFHLANQRTAADTARIAEQTQRDSASMITIAAVTMLFLPGTFICAILSTTFFDFGENGLQVSSQWWVLLAATIPLTIIVFIIWWGWQQLRRRRQLHKTVKAKVELQKLAVSM